MNTQKPMVSVVMCNYNTKEEYLRNAIESVLGQTYENFEFIIIDDASTGNDIEIIKSYRDARIILLQNDSNHHVSYTANRGLALAQGEYIARMDSDDICLPYRLEKQVSYMQKNPNIDILCAQARMIGDRKGVFAPGLRCSNRAKAALFFGCPIVHPTVMFRTSFVKKHEVRYDTSIEYKAAEDFELWSRCIALGKICEYPRVLIHYRVHSSQISTLTGKMQIESANRVRFRMLDWLGIKQDQNEISVHYLLCTDTISPEVSLKETESWARRLLLGNKQHRVFVQRYFKQEILQHFFITAVKTLIRRHTGLSELIRLRLFWKALSPTYFPGYFKRFLFSRRLNRVI